MASFKIVEKREGEREEQKRDWSFVYDSLEQARNGLDYLYEVDRDGSDFPHKYEINKSFQTLDLNVWTHYYDNKQVKIIEC